MIIDPEQAVFSRPSIPFGTKCDDKVQADVPGQLKEALTALAYLDGYPSLGAYVRAVLHEDVYGRMSAVRMRGHGLVPEGEESDR